MSSRSDESASANKHIAKEQTKMLAMQAENAALRAALEREREENRHLRRHLRVQTREQAEGMADLEERLQRTADQCVQAEDEVRDLQEQLAQMLKEPVQEALRGDIQALNEAVETHQDQVTNLLEYISRLKAELAVKEETIESITAGMNGLGVTEGAADHPEHADTADEPDRSVEPMDI